MARIARIVVPDVAHHVTQRGNRRQPVFFSQSDYADYLRLVSASCRDHEVRCLAWCLMPNHVHLILVPSSVDGLRGALAEAHRRHASRVNRANGWTGYLFQGRFASYPMGDAHMAAAVRYVELNPVKAGLVAKPEQWRWSSARAHISGRGDGLTDLAATSQFAEDWSAMLLHGLEHADGGDEAAAAIETSLRTGRPWGDARFVAWLEQSTGRALKPQKRGRKPRRIEISIVSPN